MSQNNIYKCLCQIAAHILQSIKISKKINNISNSQQNKNKTRKFLINTWSYSFSIKIFIKDNLLQRNKKSQWPYLTKWRPSGKKMATK